MQQVHLFLNSLNEFFAKLMAFMPSILAALALLFIGWVIAKLIRTGVLHLLKAIQFNMLAEKSGVEAFLKQGGVKVSLAGIISELCYWLIMVIVIVAIFNSLGLTTVAELFNKVVLYIPYLIVAVLVLVFGTMLARFTHRLLFTYLNNIGVEGARTISTLAEYVIQIFVIVVALEQLQIATELLSSAFKIAFGAFCFALALAFGLGGREWAARMIDKLTSRK